MQECKPTVFSQRCHMIIYARFYYAQMITFASFLHHGLHMARCNTCDTFTTLVTLQVSQKECARIREGVP